MLIVSPNALSAMIEHRIDKGIETAMMIVPSPTAQEDQDHNRGQACSNDRLTDHTIDRGSHKDGLIADRE